MSQALAELKDSTGDTSEEQAALTAELEKWKEELANAEAGQNAAERGVENWQQQLNKAKIELNETNEAISENDKYLDEAKKVNRWVRDLYRQIREQGQRLQGRNNPARRRTGRGGRR